MTDKPQDESDIFKHQAFTRAECRALKALNELAKESEQVNFEALMNDEDAENITQSTSVKIDQ